MMSDRDPMMSDEELDSLLYRTDTATRAALAGAIDLPGGLLQVREQADEEVVTCEPAALTGTEDYAAAVRRLAYTASGPAAKFADLPRRSPSSGSSETLYVLPDEPAASPQPRPPSPRPSSPSLLSPSPVVANKIPELKSDTVMQKVVLPGLVDLTLGNIIVPGRFDPYRIAGFVTRLEDVPAGSSTEVARRYGLNQVPGWPSTEELHVLRFYAHCPELYIAPFERNVYQLDLLELPAGAELWRIDAEGSELRAGVYLNRQVGWVNTAPLRLGPGLWNAPPVSLVPTVRRGLIATFQGQDFDTDFGPRPGEVTLHPLPGTQPPKNFTEQAGTFTLQVRISDLDALEMVRWRAEWRKLPVEIVESAPQRVVIHYIGENGRRASDSGLAEVDYRVWRGSVVPSDLADVHQQRVPLQFGCAGHP